MHCQNCAYPLINLTEPRCPECGEGFDLRDFRFEPGSVAFACPDCGHQHEGDGPNYQPSDAESMACRGCGHDIAVATMRVVPLVGELHAAPTQLTPWDQWCHRNESWWKLLKSKGWRPAYRTPMRYWTQTWQLSMLNPGKLGDLIGRQSSWRHAMRFVADTIAVLVMLYFLAAVGIALAVMIAEQVQSPGSTTFTGDFVDLLQANMGLTLLTMAISPLLLTVAVHSMLNLTGKTRGPMRMTACAVAYAFGPAVAAAVPFMGLPVAVVWVLLSMMILVSRAQQVSLLRAAVACLWAPLLLFVLPSVMLLLKWVM